MHTYMHVHLYVCVHACVVCVNYMYVYMHVCVCVCVCVSISASRETARARASMHVCIPVASSIISFVHPQSIRTQRCTAPSVDKASRKGAACEGKELGVADGARLVLVDLSEERH